jgi:hypothetical protein
MEACLEKAKANPGRSKGGREEMEAKSLKKRPQWKLSEHWRTDMGTDISRRALPTAEEPDPER